MRGITVLWGVIPGLSAIPVFCQGQEAVLSGYVRDSLSHEPVLFARIFVSGTQIGTTSNEYGYYSLRLKPGTWTLKVQAFGYHEKEFTITIQRGERLRKDLLLVRQVIQLEKVQVRARKAFLENPEPSRIQLSQKRIREIPVVLGEHDPVRALRLLPGVQSAGDETQGLIVRGGRPDQVLTLLDDATVYNPGHLFGMFSIFNPDAIKDVTMYRGGIPPRYGNRLSAVLDVRAREGNMRHWAIRGGLGLISSRLVVEGPLWRDRVSVLVAARRTYFDLLFRRYLQDFQYFFYDMNAKIHVRLSERSFLFLSAYLGDDFFTFQAPDGHFQFAMPWGNRTFTIRWTRAFSNGAFLRVSGVYNLYRSEIRASEGDLTFRLLSYVRDLGVRLQWMHPSWKPDHSVRAGIDLIHHTLSPLAASLQSGEEELLSLDTRYKYLLEIGMYVEDVWKVSERLTLSGGIRYSVFSHWGPFKLYRYDALRNPVDSLEYGPLQLIQAYHGPEPRLSVHYQISPSLAWKTSLMFTRQYMQMVSNSALSTPFDLWIPASQLIRPASMIEFATGLYTEWYPHHKWELRASAGGYGRYLWNVLEFRDNYVPDVNIDVEYDLLHGKGYSYGAEMSLEVHHDPAFSAIVGYTLSWTWYQFDSLNQGEPFPAKYDRRHDLSLLFTWKPHRRWIFSLTFVFGTGNTMTVPEKYAVVQFYLVPIYTRRNNLRLPPYHRMDVSITYRFRIARRFPQELVLTLYNLYNRQNIFFIWLRTEGDWTSGLKQDFMQVTLFPFLPSLTWNFRFDFVRSPAGEIPSP